MAAGVDKSEAVAGMKRLLSSVLLCVAFFVGYYVGHRPGSPDLVPFVQKCYGQATVAYGRAAQWVRAEVEKMNPSSGQGAAAEQANCGRQGSEKN